MAGVHPCGALQKNQEGPSILLDGFHKPEHAVCPVSMAAQFQAFKSLMGTEIAEDPGRSDVAASGLTGQVSTSDPSDESACLSADITTNELHECIKKQKRGKSSDIDGVVAEMIKDGGKLLQRCILWLFNCMLASHGCEHLPIGLITAVHKTGDKSDRATAEAFYSSLWLPNSLQRYESRESLKGLTSAALKPGDKLGL